MEEKKTTRLELHITPIFVAFLGAICLFLWAIYEEIIWFPIIMLLFVVYALYRSFKK